MRNNTFSRGLCIICGKPCDPAPTKRGWFDFDAAGHTKQIHYDCVDWLKETADIMRARQARALHELERKNAPKITGEL